MISLPKRCMCWKASRIAAENGHVCAIATDNVTWASNPSGRKIAEIIGPEDTLIKAYGLNQDTRPNVAEEDKKTVCKGVFPRAICTADRA